MAVRVARATLRRSGSGTLAPLRIRDYRRFWLGTLVSQAGDQLQMVALAVLALDLTHSAATLSTAAAFILLANAMRGVCAISYVTIVQTHAPAEMRGRVTALFMLGVMGLSPLSLGIGGVLSDAVGPRGLFFVGGTVLVIAGAYALAHRAFREAT